MTIKFSVDRIKNMDLLYEKMSTDADQLSIFEPEEYEEHYHGNDYCKRIIRNAVTDDKWAEPEYFGSTGRIANETFRLKSLDGGEYQVEFSINTYQRSMARMECTITAPETENFDHKLEDLKISIKNQLLPDWEVCTWLVDEQSVRLCKEAYEKAFLIENRLRAFASKVLIHFLGIDWIKRAGLEKEAESVENLKQKFMQRVPEFDDINADFLSMTLETLMGIMFNGIVYKEDVVLSRKEYEKILGLCGKNVAGSNVAEYVKARRVKDKDIWKDLFVPYIDDPDRFQKAGHDFIEDRNHVAHSKILSWSAYQIILSDFEEMDTLILDADSKFEREETSDELLETWEEEREEEYHEREFYRDRIASETGIDILNEQEIKDWFDEVLGDLYGDVYQRYHLDCCYEISDFCTPADHSVCFFVSSPVVEDGSARINIVSDYSIDDELGEDSTCTITCQDSAGGEVCSAEVHFHNGNGYEGEKGFMVVSDDTEYDISELDEFREELFYYIDEKLNPYPGKLDVLVYENQGADEFVADFACEQCGKFGVSVNEDFLPVGRCCYCGCENEVQRCERCGNLINADAMEKGLCPSCATYIDAQ